MGTRHVVESGILAERGDDGTYPVRIITEGEGSTGIYSRELLERSADVFSGLPSFVNHPQDPAKPHLRDAKSIAGRIVKGSTEFRVGEDGLAAIHGRYKPNRDYADWIEENADLLGLSIFIGAAGEEDTATGKLVLESFDEKDPYGAVDIVVAAGRGGRFERAAESLRAIESSLGTPAAKPGAASASGEKEDHMDPKVVEELRSLIRTEFAAIVAEQKGLADKAAQAEADAEAAVAKRTADAVEAYAAAAKAVAEADLLEPQAESILEAARKGADYAPLIESAKKVVEAADKRAAEKRDEGGFGRVVESGSASDTDFTIAGWN